MTSASSGGTAPVITSGPVGASLVSGQTLTLAASATGTGPLTFSWWRNGSELSPPGFYATVVNTATTSTYTIRPVVPGDSGSYTVTVRNAYGSVVSGPAVVTVNSTAIAPSFLVQPASRSVTAGTTVQFSVTVLGTPLPTIMWLKNGTTIPGATSTTLTIANATTADAGTYRAVAANSAGTSFSQIATLSLVSVPEPVRIATQPTSVTTSVGEFRQFTVVATGTDPLTYQWSKDGKALPGQTRATLNIVSATLDDAGFYTVSVTNPVGTVVSQAAQLFVFSPYSAASYFGQFGNGLFVLTVSAVDVATLLAVDPASGTVVFQKDIAIGRDGTFSFHTSKNVAGAGRILPDGSVAGSVSPPNLLLSGNRETVRINGPIPTDLYRLIQNDGSGVADLQLAATGRGLVVFSTPAGLDCGNVTVSENGLFSGQTLRGATIGGRADLVTIDLTLTLDSPTTRWIGRSIRLSPRERLTNLSLRARVDAGGSPLIGGFVIAGDSPRDVLVRAIGPTLSALGVAGALPVPRLEMFAGSERIAVNSGWSTSGNADGIAAAARRTGAFALEAGSADSAILITLMPGAYTAAISSGDSRSGSAVLEVYDASIAEVPGTKLVNLSARTSASSDEPLIAGFTVTGTRPRRMLIRAVGPTLETAFGLAGAMSDPQLRLHRAGETLPFASNDNWAEAIRPAWLSGPTADVGGFPLGAGSRDAALLIGLSPGVYSVVVGPVSTGGSTLVELYDAGDTLTPDLN